MQEHVVSDTACRTTQEHDNHLAVLQPSTDSPENTSSISTEGDIRDAFEPECLPSPDSNAFSGSYPSVGENSFDHTSLGRQSSIHISDVGSELGSLPLDQGSHAGPQRLERSNEQDLDPWILPSPASRSVSSEDSREAGDNVTVPNSTVYDRPDIETFEHIQTAFQSTLPHIKEMWRVRSISNLRGSVSIFKTAWLPIVPTWNLRSYDFRYAQQEGPQALSLLMQGGFSPYDDTRVVIVQDLSPFIIELIHNMVRPSPEFFEQHLKGSLYGQSSIPHKTEESRSSAIWSTSLLPRSHCSLRWWRPVVRRHQNGLNNVRWADLLRHGHTEWQSEHGNTIVNRRVSKIPNISRAEFDNMARFPDAIDNTKSTNEHSAEASLEGTDEDEQIGEEDTMVTAWEERVTIHHSVRDGVVSIIMLTDPLPRIRQESSRHGPGEGWLPFTQVCPRDRPTAIQDGSLDNIGTFKQTKDLKRYLNDTSPSGSDILSWMSTTLGDERANRQSGSWQAILKVVEIDTLCFINIVLDNLDGITEGITDEILLQDRLYKWRPSVTRYLLELPRMKASLLEFKSFMTTCEVTGEPYNSIDNLSRLIDDAYLQAEKVYNSLRTEMSIIDSRRGIREAEGVSKLTELAFVFIPITFAASVFSMQIKELETAPPLYAFIITASLCVIISYAIRLSIRSDVLLDTKRRFFNNVRDNYDIPPNRPVTTRKFIAYIFHTDQFHHVGYLLGLGAVLASVLVLLWTKSHLNNFFKAAITALAIAMMLLCTMWYLPCVQSVLRFLAARLEKSEQRRTQREGGVQDV